MHDRGVEERALITVQSGTSGFKFPRPNNSAMLEDVYSFSNLQKLTQLKESQVRFHQESPSKAIRK